MLSIPNLLTFLRLLLVPIVVVAFFLPIGWSHLAAGWIFFIAGITDLLDGWVARYFKQETQFGAFLDPIADKIMVVAVLILLVQVHTNAVFAICAILIASREITISALREWLAGSAQNNMGVSLLGKIKTFTQMISLTLLLLNIKGVYELWGIVGLVLFYIATVLTIVSMALYFKHNWKAMFADKKTPNLPD